MKRELYFTEGDMDQAYLYGINQRILSDYDELKRRLRKHNILHIIEPLRKASR